MRKMLVISAREYQAAVRTKTFIISIVAMPLFVGGSFLVQRIARERVDTGDKRYVVFDQTGKLFQSLAEAANRRNENEIFSGEGPDRKKVKPRFVVERAEIDAADGEQAALELSQQVRDGHIMGFIIIGPGVLDPQADPEQTAIAYHSNAPTYDDFREWAAGVLNEHIQTRRLQAAGLDPAVVRQTTQPVPVRNLTLVTLDDAGQITRAQETSTIVNMLLPFGLMMLMFLVIMIGAPPLMQGVLEEKMQRIAEVLLGSVRPFELMTGKLLGMVGVSLTVVTIYLAGAFFAVRQAGYGQFFPAQLIWWFVIFQALAVLMYGSLFIAIGAAVTDMKEAQNLMTPLMLVIVAPMFVWVNVVREPLSSSSLVLSLIPPATPMLMILRQAVPPGVPIWQPMVGIVLVLLSTLFCVFIAGRIFRVGLLMQGKGANLREMARWVVRG